MISEMIRQHRERRLAGLKARLEYWKGMRLPNGNVPSEVVITVSALLDQIAQLETALQQTKKP